jgi:hypothetical protein
MHAFNLRGWKVNRAFVADTTALILFFTTTGIVNERFIAGMSWQQVVHARLLGAALMVPVGRPYGIWRDWVLGQAGPSRLSRLLWDSLALVSFQVPIYAAIVAVSGASGLGLLMGVLGATAIMLVCGRPYGAFLGLVRSCFGLRPGSLMQTDLGPRQDGTTASSNLFPDWRRRKRPGPLRDV